MTEQLRKAFLPESLQEVQPDVIRCHRYVTVLCIPSLQMHGILLPSGRDAEEFNVAAMKSCPCHYRTT